MQLLTIEHQLKWFNQSVLFLRRAPPRPGNPSFSNCSFATSAVWLSSYVRPEGWAANENSGEEVRRSVQGTGFGQPSSPFISDHIISALSQEPGPKPELTAALNTTPQLLYSSLESRVLLASTGLLQPSNLEPLVRRRCDSTMEVQCP